jgi:hypothetical protein
MYCNDTVLNNNIGLGIYTIAGFQICLSLYSWIAGNVVDWIYLAENKDG